LEFVTTIVAGLVALAVLVVIHEAGHMVVAKIFKVGVPVFSVGMGPRLIGFYWGGTDWRLSMLPVGGYVRMAGADPFGEEDPDDVVPPEDDFMRKPVWQRLLIMLAGPVANLILPVVLLTGVYMLGEPQNAGVIGSVTYDSPAHDAGLQIDDRIVAVNGAPVEVWPDLQDQLAQFAGQDVVLDIDRAGEPIKVTIRAGAYENIGYGFPHFQALGVSWARQSARIGVDDPASPAYKAGLRTGDGVVAVDGQAIEDWLALRAALGDAERHEVRFRRGNREAQTVTEDVATLTSDPTWTARADDPYADRWGIVPVDVFVGRVIPDSAALTSGVQDDDRLYAIDGVLVRGFDHLINLVKQTAATEAYDAEPRPLDLTLIRAGERVSLTFTPQMKRETQGAKAIYRPIMGITKYTGDRVSGPTVVRYYSITEAVPRASNESMLCSGTSCRCSAACSRERSGPRSPWGVRSRSSPRPRPQPSGGSSHMHVLSA